MSLFLLLAFIPLDTYSSNFNMPPPHQQIPRPTFETVDVVPHLTSMQIQQIEEIQNMTAPKLDKVRFPSGYVIHDPRGFEINSANIDITPKSISALSKIHVVIQFNGPLRGERLQFLKSNDIQLDEALGNYAYYATIPLTKIGILERSKFVKWLGKISKEGKIRNEFLEETISKPNESFKVYVSLFGDVREEYTDKILKQFSNEIFSYAPQANFYLISINGSDIAKLLDLEFVKLISNYSVPIPTNENGLAATATDTVFDWGPLRGSWVNVAIVDTGVAYQSGTYHPDLPTPIDQYDFCGSDNYADDQEGHGTHVSGIALGRGNDVSYRKGVAPSASLMMYKWVGCASSASFETVMRRLIMNGADISSNSWAWGWSNGQYSEPTGSAIVDRAINGEYPDSNGKSRPITVVVAGGNENLVVSNPGTNKNGITVGASTAGNDDNRDEGSGSVSAEPAANYAWFSNYGPINGRIKPDVIAPGLEITSSYPWYLDITKVYPNPPYSCVHPASNPYYAKMCGTSMATPHVSGIAALMMEAASALKDWPELLKARLLGSAVYLDNLPESRQGRGHVSAYYAIYDQLGAFEQLQWYGGYVGGPFDPDDEITFEVPSGYKEVEVTLAYSDDAGAGIMQDLDTYLYDSNNNLISSDTRDDTTKQFKISSALGRPSGTWRLLIGAASTTRQTKYGIFVSVRKSDPSLSLIKIPSPDPVPPSGALTIYSILENGGFVTVGSYIELKVPSGFTLTSVDIHRNDGISFTLPASELYYRSSDNSYRVSVGEAIKDFQRKVDWHLTAPSTTGSYLFTVRYGAQNFAETQDNFLVTVGSGGGGGSTVTVAYPNGGEIIPLINASEIFWKVPPYTTHNYNLYWGRASEGYVWHPIVTGYTCCNIYYPWNVSGLADGNDYKVKVIHNPTGDWDVSDSTFIIDHGGGGSGDTEPPNITHSPVTSANEGNPILIYATITDNVSVINATLYYRMTGLSTYSPVSMSNNGSNYSATIPAFAVTTAGVQYYIMAMDNSSNTAYSPSTAPTVPYTINVTGRKSKAYLYSFAKRFYNLGDTVRTRIIVKNDGGAIDDQLFISIRDPSGKKIYSRVEPIHIPQAKKWEILKLEWKIPANATLGKYKLTAEFYHTEGMPEIRTFIVS